ncbi:hypothetical protein HYS48_04495 [Candidatus Woesearchaeota archaeon]|nr:hypothetical protein [Candidatus Woesearchaeota archaeon]
MASTVAPSSGQHTKSFEERMEAAGYLEYHRTQFGDWAIRARHQIYPVYFHSVGDTLDRFDVPLTYSMVVGVREFSDAHHDDLDSILHAYAGRLLGKIVMEKHGFETEWDHKLEDHQYLLVFTTHEKKEQIFMAIVRAVREYDRLVHSRKFKSLRNKIEEHLRKELSSLL